MSRIPLSEGFSIIPEGTEIFKITEVVYKEEFGKLEVKMVTAKGQKHTERFSLVTANGSSNEGAINAFSYFAKTALGDYELTEIDHDDLVGHYIKCVVEHEKMPSTKDPSRTVTFVRLTDKFPATGFERGENEPTKVTSTTSPSPVIASTEPKVVPTIDLDKLLG